MRMYKGRNMRGAGVSLCVGTIKSGTEKHPCLKLKGGLDAKKTHHIACETVESSVLLMMDEVLKRLKCDQRFPGDARVLIDLGECKLRKSLRKVAAAHKAREILAHGPESKSFKPLEFTFRSNSVCSLRSQ